MDVVSKSKIILKSSFRGTTVRYFLPSLEAFFHTKNNSSTKTGLMPFYSWSLGIGNLA